MWFFTIKKKCNEHFWIVSYTFSTFKYPYFYCMGSLFRVFKLPIFLFWWMWPNCWRDLGLYTDQKGVSSELVSLTLGWNDLPKGCTELTRGKTGPHRRALGTTSFLSELAGTLSQVWTALTEPRWCSSVFICVCVISTVPGAAS